VLAAVLLGALVSGAHWLGSLGTPRAAGADEAPVSVQTDDAVPARGPVMIGSSAAEAPGETWGIGEVGPFNSGSFAIVRYAEGDGWSISPWVDAAGQPPSEEILKPVASPLTGAVTSTGAAALLATVTGESGGTPREVVLVRDPGGDFREVPPVHEEGEGALIGPGESLFSRTRAPLVAALDEGEGRGGALVVPVNSHESGVDEDGVLHWDGRKWTREQIEVPPTSREHHGFRVLAIGASSPTDAWLLGQLSPQVSPGGVELFRRHVPGSGAPVWWPVTRPGGFAGEPLATPVSGGSEAPFTVEGTGEPPTSQGQSLTVTGEGVWLDGQTSGTALTMFLGPEGEEAAQQRYTGRVRASWCETGCTYPLPEGLPAGPSRSFAWADPANPYGFGQRVITGFDEGVSLRLEGASFARVLALGAGAQSFEDVGGTHGAAFSSPTEGWLGNERMPVHITEHPAPNRLAPYPVPFHHALLAVAAQPGAPVGALSSQALAVGEKGEVARYTPGEGWQPETLFRAGGAIARPTLRAAAWPAPGRAYAVGQLDEAGDAEMWLWRGETGLWEPDPAMPRNFRGNLLGVAFDPNNPARGYAVGQGGVLLRYGKSWVQESLPAEILPAETPGRRSPSTLVNFTSIAFAGSEALVAFRVAHPEEAGHGAFYTGGLLVNGGSGWHVDASAGAALAGGIPWAVAALPDGGAALSGISAHEEPLVLERDGPHATWQPTPVPYAGGEPPGSLALFREGGALRVVGSGGIPNTAAIDFPAEHEPPVGFPAQLIKPYPPATGYVRRQTPTGWSDEEHDRDEVGSPIHEFKRYDEPYKPDPTGAVLLDETGTHGWALGGELEAREGLDTADVARYPADGVAPPGSAPAPVPVEPGVATFAIAGGAQCAAACADRANARLGPDVWLASALQEASQIGGVRAFFYTGARVSAGEGRIHAAPVPHARELQRYAGLLSAGSLASYAAPSATDLAGGEGECVFKQFFAGFHAPFGMGEAAAGLTPAGGSSESCSTGQSGYYALDSSGSSDEVRVIVLDETVAVGSEQLAWLAAELAQARARHEPAIVIGNGAPGGAVAQALIAGSASAYFYDAPEENVTGRVGSSTIPSFGSGTLGYVSSVNAERQNFIGHSGLLLAQVGAFNPAIGRAAVTARLIPAIGELALEAKEGILLHRSQAALFAALARRPRAGCLADGEETACTTSQYVPIPAECVGSACASGIFPEYRFSSSRTDIGNFVEPNLASGDPHAVLLGAEEKPIPDPSSGLFCAYNAGTTIVTISAGGLSASLPVTVQAGSVRRPCGTTKLNELPSKQSVTAPPPPNNPPPPGGQAPAPIVPVPPPPAPTASPAPPPVIHPAALLPFTVPGSATSSLIPFVPPPPPTPARPTPPTGMSQVVQHEEEEEEATESVSNQAVAYRAAEDEPSPLFVLGIVILAAFAGASARKRMRRGRRAPRVAPATIVSSQAQRRAGERR